METRTHRQGSKTRRCLIDWIMWGRGTSTHSEAKKQIEMIKMNERQTQGRWGENEREAKTEKEGNTCYQNADICSVRA